MIRNELENEISKEFYTLNEIELFLRKFLEEYPYYKLNIVDTHDDSMDDFNHLLQIMRNQWKKKYKKKPFFLTDNASYIKEDFFFLPDENVAMRKNLRYMPMTMHSHQFIELNYVLKSDSASMITRSGALPLHDGDIILCPPNFVHCFNTMSDNSIILDFFIRITTFDTTFFQLLNCNDYLSTVFSNALYNCENNYILWHCENDTSLKELVLSSYNEWEQKPKYSNQMLEVNIIHFFILLLRNHENQAIFSLPQVKSVDSVFQTFHNYMLLHCHNVTLSSMATQFGYSERQIIRILKKNSGKGFSELLQDIRMNKALQLIKAQDMSINQIASILGYSSVSYFHKVFKKTFSFTPEAFIERIQHNNI